MNNQRTNIATPGTGTAPTVQNSANTESVYNNTPTTSTTSSVHTSTSISLHLLVNGQNGVHRVLD